MTPTITRKEIAALAGCCVATVERHEKEWGIDAFRSKAVEWPICYFRQKTEEHLRKIGVMPPAP